MNILIKWDTKLRVADLIDWMYDNVGRPGCDWDIAPYNKEMLEITLVKENIELACEIKLRWDSYGD